MEALITNLMGQAALTSAIVLAFVEFLKRGIPAKYFPSRLYPWAALVCGIITNLFFGMQLGMSIMQCCAMGAVSAFMAIGVFKYGKYEESKGNSLTE